MFLTLNSFFDDESSTIQVDSSVIDVSEFKDEGDQAFLITQGHDLLLIDAKANYAKEQITKIIDQKSADAKGKIIYGIQEKFKESKELKGGLLRYFHSLGYWSNDMERMKLQKPEKSQSLSASFRWANGYRAALEMQEKLKGSMTPEEIQARAASLHPSVLSRIYTGLSEDDREEFYKSGQIPTVKEATELVRTPEAKLSKAEELLEAARDRKRDAEMRWEQVKADPEITSQDNDYVNAQGNKSKTAKAEEELWLKVQDLQKQVDAKEAELNKFKFDEDVQRQTRIKFLTDALTVGVPQATADLNKYIKDADYYPCDVRRHFDDQIKVLADMCGDYLSRI